MTRIGVLLLAVVMGAAALPKMELGVPGERCLRILGAMTACGEYVLGTGEHDPSVHFSNSLTRLVLYGNASPSVTYMWQHKFDYGKYAILDCKVKWNIGDVFSVTGGQMKAPFDRFSSSSGVKLIFRDRNPIASFAPKYQIGVVPAVTLFGEKVTVHAGVFNGKGLNVHTNTGPNVMLATSAVVSPFGLVPMEESAHRGFDKPVFAVVPGVYRNPVQTVSRRDSLTGEPLEYVDVTTLGYGCGGAFRYDYLAFDAGYYVKQVDDPTPDAVVNSTGWSVQAAYAVRGRLEPVLRYSVIDPDSGADSDETATIEAGVNYYINSYDLHVGLNYVGSVQRVTGNEDIKTSILKLFFGFIF